MVNLLLHLFLELKVLLDGLPEVDLLLVLGDAALGLLDRVQALLDGLSILAEFTVDLKDSSEVQDVLWVVLEVSLDIFVLGENEGVCFLIDSGWDCLVVDLVNISDEVFDCCAQHLGNLLGTSIWVLGD